MAASDMVVSMVGDCLMQHRLSVYTDERFMKFVELLRGSDVSIGNFEAAVYTGKEPPAFVAGGSRGGGIMAAPPFAAQELQWLGFRAMWASNNHAADLGEPGMLATMGHLGRVGIACPGIGRSLTEASAPAYVDTPRGRLALISVSDWGPRGRADLPYPAPFGVLAADNGPAFPDRPGQNLLRFDAVIHVDREMLGALRRASRQLGWEEAKDARRRGGARDEPMVGERIVGGEEDDERAFHFMGARFLEDTRFTFETVPYAEDLERNCKWIREAGRQADVVVVGLHQQGASRDDRESPDHTRIFARRAIEAGADVFVAHGRGRIGGIEVYQGKVIIHGLPGFIRQREQLRHAPPEHMARWGLAPGSTAADFLERRDAAEQGSAMPPGFRRTAVYTVVASADGGIAEVRVYPGEMSGGSRAQSGRPLWALPDSEMSRRVLDSVARRSAEFGTRVEVRDGVAVAKVSA